jgi:hypothetical protein
VNEICETSVDGLLGWRVMTDYVVVISHGCNICLWGRVVIGHSMQFCVF